MLALLGLPSVAERIMELAFKWAVRSLNRSTEFMITHAIREARISKNKRNYMAGLIEHPWLDILRKKANLNRTPKRRRIEFRCTSVDLVIEEQRVISRDARQRTLTERIVHRMEMGKDLLSEIGRLSRSHRRMTYHWIIRKCLKLPAICGHCNRAGLSYAHATNCTNIFIDRLLWNGQVRKAAHELKRLIRMTNGLTVEEMRQLDCDGRSQIEPVDAPPLGYRPGSRSNAEWRYC